MSQYYAVIISDKQFAQLRPAAGLLPLSGMADLSSPSFKRQLRHSESPPARRRWAPAYQPTQSGHELHT